MLQLLRTRTMRRAWGRCLWRCRMAPSPATWRLMSELACCVTRLGCRITPCFIRLVKTAAQMEHVDWFLLCLGAASLFGEAVKQRLTACVDLAGMQTHRGAEWCGICAAKRAAGRAAAHAERDPFHAHHGQGVQYC